jgi:hypothetical protein
MIRQLGVLLILGLLAFSSQAKELAGIAVPDNITLSNGDALVLNGMGLREKLWIDVYVGSLYLPQKANTVADVLSQPGAFRIQMDFVYNEVSSSKLIDAWKEGFEKNQSEETLKALADRMQRFYQLFEESAKKGDQYIIDYIPQQGCQISKNNIVLGRIEGEDFKTAVLEIWLGNFPADKSLKRGMLGQ